MKNLPKYLLVVALFICLQSNGQNEKISIGVKLLPGISNSNGKLIETSFKLNLGGGLQFVTNFNKLLGLETGAYFQNHGYKFDAALTDASGQILSSPTTVSQNFNYICIPVLLRININSFYFGLGPKLNLLLSANTNFSNIQSVSGASSGKVKIKNANSVVFEPNLSFGYQIAIANKFGINLECRFSTTVNGIYGESNDIQIMNLGLGAGFSYFIVSK